MPASVGVKRINQRLKLCLEIDFQKFRFLWINISVLYAFSVLYLIAKHNPNFYFLRYKSKSSIPAVVPGMSSGTNFIKNGATKGRPCPPGKDSEFYV